MFKNHPRGLIPAALSNMGERFGYYIMNAVLVLFLCSKFGLSEKTSTMIYSVFYAGIYVLSLVGGLIADRLRNYKGTITSGLIVMASGYVLLSIPILSTHENIGWLLPLTCVALFLIAFGNGLFKGNLQAIVGQMYDNPKYSKYRDSGFQIFYVFINIGGLIAPFVAPLLRSWWLNRHALTYNADLPALCHKYMTYGENIPDVIDKTGKVVTTGAEQFTKLNELITSVGGNISDLAATCSQYLDVFNTGVHYSFIASVAAMVISLVIFLSTKKIFPNPMKKEAEIVNYTAEEKAQMSKEIKQRIYALFAVLGIAVVFWWSFHQNGTSLSLFARDFVVTKSIAPEIWQAVNPFFVIVLTPLIMWFFGALGKRGKTISTPRKIAIGMGIAAIAYLFLTIVSNLAGYPSATEFKGIAAAISDGLKMGPWVLIVMYFFMTVAELFISPLGLSFVSKVAPKNLQGLCQGLWLAATALGNLLLWIGPWMYNNWPIWQCWLVFAIVCVVSMSVMLLMVRWLERVTGDKVEEIPEEA
ncbi:MAG: peptide MFS transporter [Bacteroidales bacterium]|jgi:POT family proton-dependent oligopeptide transporter|nr:peptide MFS transporter [Bacteroidales bacterium]